MLTLSAVSLHVRTTRTDLSSIRSRQDKQLGWMMSNRDSFKQSANRAVTLWPKISFPGASPKRAKQHEHNKSPPPDISIMEPLVVNFCFLVFMPNAYYTAISPKTRRLVKPCEKHFKKKSSLWHYYQWAYLLKAFLNVRNETVPLDNSQRKQRCESAFPKRKDTR